MRQCIFLYFLMCLLQSSIAQGSRPEVVSTTGGTFSDETIHLDWTIGEIAISSLSTSSEQLTQGFHQPSYKLVSGSKLPPNIGIIEVFPNPTQDIIRINAKLNRKQKVQIRLIDLQGKIIVDLDRKGVEITETLDLSLLSSGSYIISLTPEDARAYKLFKIIKI